MSNELIVAALAFLGGFIDSIAGGGGLITMPMWTLVLGPGAHVVATNKVGALTAATTALAIYARHHKLPWREGLAFLLAIMAGSAMGSRLTALFDTRVFAWMLLGICPLVLWMVWSRDKLFAERPPSPPQPSRFILAGFLVGVYDGFFGPGGGTFMLLALLSFTQMPLMQALALSKLANALSAGTSLVSFASQSLVLWRWGILGAVFITVGSFFGARMASRQAAKVLRPTLSIVVLLLMAKLLVDLLKA